MLKPKPTADAVAELKAQETCALARQLPLLDLQTRIRLDDGTTGFLEALEGAPPGFPIAPPELFTRRASAIAEANPPEVGISPGVLLSGVSALTEAIPNVPERLDPGNAE